jgi:hypothetical protein
MQEIFLFFMLHFLKHVCGIPSERGEPGATDLNLPFKSTG